MGMMLLSRNADSIFVFLAVDLRPLKAVCCSELAICMCVEFFIIVVGLRDE